jgi:PAS domain S-box-containing protein
LVELIKFPNLTNAKKFLEASRDAVFIIYDEKIEYVNDRTVKLLGFSDASELINRWSCEFIPPEDKGARYKPAGKNTPFRYELKLRRRDGTTVDVENQISIIEYGGKPSSLVFSRDITERKLFGAKLDAIHRHAVEMGEIDTLDGIAKSTMKILQEELGFHFVGFGVVEGDMLYFKELSDSNVMKMPLDGTGITVRAVNTGETQFVPDTRKDPDFVSSKILGKPENLSEICVPIKVRDTVFGALKIESEKPNAFDGNDRKLLETLAKHIASSIAILQAKEKQRIILEELSERNRELDEYTYIVSHDLKSPLRSIQTFSTFLLEEASSKLDDKERGYISRIIMASKRMSELIEDLLLLSSINRKFLDVEVIDLKEIVNKVETDLEVLIAERGARIQCIDLPEIQGHRVWMQQLFTNLINNGLKFNDSPIPEIVVGFEDHYDFYLFLVKDNGIGIEEKDYQKIFKLFQRLHTKEEYPGTGAGLTICKKIVESYGGKIWVESKPEVGTTFYFTIPKDVLKMETSDFALAPDESVQLVED